MPTVEDYFDDDTDLPLPSSSSTSRQLPNQGLKGALLEEITSEDEIDNDMMDFSKLAEQSRGVFGESNKAPPPGSGKGKVVVRENDGELRPTAPGGGGGGGMNPNTPMGGFMGDMMKLQQVEEERMAKLRQQMGNTKLAADPSVYKGWNTVYPIYFDAKVSINDGRRVPRKDSVWWPQATYISRACSTLGLPSVLEPDKTHPADWANPGRVKVQFIKDGRFINPIVKNRTQLYRHISSQIQQSHPDLIFKPTPKTSKPSATASTSKAKTKKKSSSNTTTTKPSPVIKLPTRPAPPPQPVPILDDRLPLHSPVIPTGVALAAIKRDVETERENKKKGLSLGPSGEEGKEGKEKTPKIKRMVVRGKR